jgi:SpoVK/Ycf46/Vps4 family AAA+-type ATPase
LLLSGPPGTGKTLTAEAVADKTKRPLLYMHAEDLGINPSTLGANLKKMFEMATEWNGVCLLDECDVFLSARNPVDIARNELVSIFLREIEYFQGVLFLTTNLYDSIDTAFRSRVSIHLRFNPLAPEARFVLWQKFLSRMAPMVRHADLKVKAEDGEDGDEVEMMNAIDNLTEEDLKELSLWELNGREIKCVIKTVKSWCEVKKFDITLSRLEAGIKVTAPNSQKRGTVDTSLYDD